jgi:proline dehydrogenase
MIGEVAEKKGGGIRNTMAFLNRLIVSIIQLLPKRVVKRFAMRYIAGERLEDAVRVLKGLNSQKMMGTLDVLGENVTTKEESFLAVGECEKVLHTIEKNHLDANLSIKLTQFGLKIDEAFCYENVKRLLEIARGYKNFVRIDMEDSSTTSATLELYKKLRGDEFDNTGVVIQAYLRRSEEDVRRLVDLKANVRLCKGIYVEPEDIAFKDREEIRRNYLKLLETLLDASCYADIATHDDVLVRGAYQLVRERNLRKSDYGFQMLYGVRPKLRDGIVANGHRLRVYVPFGEQWYPYSIRRFKENPQIARYVLAALFSRR